MGKDRGSPGILHKGYFVFDVQLRTMMSRVMDWCFYLDVPNGQGSEILGPSKRKEKWREQSYL